MKILTSIFSVFLISLLLSCHKKHEERAGSFAGQETFNYFNGNSLSFEDSVISVNYNVEYDRDTKTYTISSENGGYLFTFHRKEFKKGHVYIDDSETSYSSSCLFCPVGATSSGGEHTVDLDENKLEVKFRSSITPFGSDFVGYLVP